MIELLDLFSGIGGFSRGLEASGHFKTTAFCEINRATWPVLQAQFPGVPIYDDVTRLTADQLRADGIVARAICGGFPCQDVSVAGDVWGLGGGVEGGKRSGLWSEFFRLIRDLRPEVAFVENVSALLGRGLARVLSDLASVGYDAEWHCLPAGHVGAPHERDRIWIVAYPGGSRLSGLEPRARELVAACEEVAVTGDSFAGLRHALAGDLAGLRGGDGLPLKLARASLGMCGNAVVPLIPEILGRTFGPHIPN